MSLCSLSCVSARSHAAQQRQALKSPDDTTAGAYKQNENEPYQPNENETYHEGYRQNKSEINRQCENQTYHQNHHYLQTDSTRREVSVWKLWEGVRKNLINVR